MDKQLGLRIVEGLRRAQDDGSPVVELKGSDARSFNWVSVEVRKNLLGSFCIEEGKKFYVLVASTPRSDQDFQFMVYEKFKGSPILTTKSATSDGVLWTYRTAKQSGDNVARKKAFLDAAKSDAITIPWPSEDIIPFSTTVNRAIELRHLADAAGGSDDEEEEDEESDDSAILEKLYSNAQDRHDAAFMLSRSIRHAHELNAKSWCVTNPGGGLKVRLNVGVLRVMDLLPGKVRLAVLPEKLSDGVRAAIGDAYTHGDPEAKIAFGLVDIAPSELATINHEIKFAHDDLIARAATLSSPFAALHHQPEIVTAVEQLVGGGPLPRPALPTRHYWKVSPGENGEQWDECRAGGYIAIGWNKLGDLTAVDHAQFKKLAEEKGASSQVWKFRNIEIGDRVVANAGTKRVLGIGTVTGPYYFVEGAKHGHRLPVHWTDTSERSVEMKGWVKTLIRLKPDAFKQIESSPVTADGMKQEKVKEADEGGPDFEDILDQLQDESLSFSAELVASYLLALQAKRFVLLTGISGTGKTKLAQEVARAFEESGEQVLPDDDGTVTIEAKPSNLKYRRFIVPSVLAQEFDALTDAETKRIDLQVPGLPKVSMALHKNVDGGSLLEVLLSGAIREWFMANIKLGDRLLLSRQTNGDQEWIDLRLGDGKRRARPAGPTSELIAVRPDWTDKSAILGFYNPLTKEYIATPILRLLLRAHEELGSATEASPSRPYFLIFDEMNLARVEHYFSDFLSAMESGDAIHLHEDAQLEESTGIPRRLRLPKNLFVIGTVNIDETTYMFSPKVLDRAFVLEFNEVNFDGIGRAVPAEAPESTPLALVNMERLEMRGRATDAEWQAFEKVLHGDAVAILRKLHDALAAEHRHFGYRVAREVARFVDLAIEQTDSSDAAARVAFDIAVLAKILPKLHGSQAEMEEILKQLLSIAIGGKPELDVFKDGALHLEAATTIPLPQTARKLWRMQRRLRARGFVSFIE